MADDLGARAPHSGADRRGPVRGSDPATHRADLPGAADLVVIGGGIAGVMTAWYAARAGWRVVLCEKGRIAGEQSSRNWGWIRQQGRDPAELPLVMESVRIWSELQSETNVDLGFRRTGTLYLGRDETDLQGYAGWLEHARAHGLDSEMLDRAGLRDKIPNAPDGWVGALWTPSDARAEPWVAVPALAQAAARDGVAIRENCAVRRLEVSGGRVTGIATEAGRVRADRVVLAGGAWSSLFLAAHGVRIPQLSVRATVAATAPMPSVFEGSAVDDKMAFRRRRDGGYSLAPAMVHDFFVGPDALRNMRAFWSVWRGDILSTGLRPAAPGGYPDAWGTPRSWQADEVSPMERVRVLDPAPSRKHMTQMRRAFSAAFPNLGTVRLRAAWAGMIDAMPDLVPVIDEAPDLPGLVVLTGLSGHGFGIGPAVGRVAADLAMGRDPGHDLSRFRLPRFTDGTRPRAYKLS